MNTYILESDSLTGPWKMVHYLKEFGTQAYFDNIPGKFISNDGKTVWLCYSANFGACCGGHPTANPPYSTYGMTLAEMELLDTDPDTTRNISLTATASASSVLAGYTVSGVNDNAIGGYPGYLSEEWASNNEKAGAWVELRWTASVTIDSIALWDRPNTTDQVTSGTLTFSDGSSLTVGSLEDSALYSTSLKFSSRTVTWVRFTVTGVKPGTLNIGLSEFDVYGTEPTTGIIQVSTDPVFIYPSPAKNILYINGLTEKSKILIYDSGGKIIFNKEITGNQIDISNFQSGVYTMKIETAKGVFTKSFVK